MPEHSIGTHRARPEGFRHLLRHFLASADPPVTGQKRILVHQVLADVTTVPVERHASPTMAFVALTLGSPGVEPDDGRDVAGVLDPVGKHHVGAMSPAGEDFGEAKGAGRRGAPQTCLPRRQDR